MSGIHTVAGVEFKKFVSITADGRERQEIRLLPPNHMYSYYLLPFVNLCSLTLETSPTRALAPLPIF